MAWSISAVDKPIFKNYIERFFGIKFPSSATIEKKNSKQLAIDCKDHIRREYQNDSIWIGYDETTDSAGRTVGGVVVGSMTDPTKPVMLGDYHELPGGSGQQMANAFINSVENLFSCGNDYKFYVRMT